VDARGHCPQQSPARTGTPGAAHPQSAVETLYQSSRVSEELLELRNLVSVGKLIVESALIRHESRGLHYNVDYPERDDQQWARDTLLRRAPVHE